MDPTKALGRLGALLIGCLFALLLAGASSAFGAVRYAEVSPGDGDPTVCAQSDPCSLQNAVQDPSVNNGDEVIVMPGTYDLGTGTVSVSKSIDLHGQAGQPRPMITTASTTAFTGAITVSAGGPTIHDLNLQTTSGSNGVGIYSASFGGVTAERLYVTATQGTPACTVYFGVLRDSVCRNTGFGSGIGLGLGSSPGTLTVDYRNVTAVTTSAAAAISVSAGSSGFNYVVNVKNMIAQSGSGSDVRVNQQTGATATINFENSNYDSIDPTSNGTATAPGTGTGNQTSPPVFVNQAAGDYHQAITSPTIDAGAAVSLLGAADFEGDARTIDSNCDGTATPDIGADELTPCPAPNNDFANAQVLTGSDATASGTNITATQEPAEDNYCTEDVCGNNSTVTHSVWYRWTSPGNGPATVDLCNANDYDTMLSVFTGSVLGSLSWLVANNNSPDCPPGSYASKVSFMAAQGTTYQILVDGCCGLPAGHFTLTLHGPAAPPPPPPPPGGGSDSGGGTTTPATPTASKCAATAKKHKKKGCRKKKKKKK